MKAFIAVVALFASLGCGSSNPARPERTLAVSNPAYPVDQLFTDPNGATVYRFYDQGEFRYYVVGPGGTHMLPSTRTSRNDSATLEIGTGVTFIGGRGFDGGHGGRH